MVATPPETEAVAPLRLNNEVILLLLGNNTTVPLVQNKEATPLAGEDTAALVDNKEALSREQEVGRSNVVLSSGQETAAPPLGWRQWRRRRG